MSKVAPFIVQPSVTAAAKCRIVFISILKNLLHKIYLSKSSRFATIFSALQERDRSPVAADWAAHGGWDFLEARCLATAAGRDVPRSTLVAALPRWIRGAQRSHATDNGPLTTAIRPATVPGE